MVLDPGIICFQHCHATTIYCKVVPEICPLCQSFISNYVTEPFRIPYPLTNATYQPTAIVIIPSKGDFLNDYDITNDLHIGLVDSKGIVTEFDADGITVNNFEKWTNCIALKVIPSSWDLFWDKTLHNTMKNSKWVSCNYNAIMLNCFNFVIEFLHNLNYADLEFTNKENLCERLILPKIQETIRYITLYRKLKCNKYFITGH